ncbi:MAG TPA: M12 family metallo-peptidase [Candidatus Saccharimonadales bacterium]|nr:M12 family metallo-peptidase [Candidatus Saccharimonadales bacterium]
MRHHALVALLCSGALLATVAWGQAAPTPAGDTFWTRSPAPVPGSAVPAGAPGLPARFQVFHVRLAPLLQRLGQAPPESRDARAGVEVTLPLPDGRIERFRAVESPILSPELQRAHPEVRTYSAAGADRAGLAARLDVTALGVRAIVLAPEGVALVDPVERGRTDQVMSHWAADEGEAGTGESLVRVRPGRGAARAATAAQAIGDQLLTLRFIYMGTGEYTQALGGVTAATAEMITTVNRINAIWQRELAVQLEVVGLMPFPDPATDPYPAVCLGNMDRNQTVVDSIFGSSSYDLAQVLEREPMVGYTGVSYVPGVCYSDTKAGSEVCAYDVTAANWRSFIKPICHELGHMLGAFHTQDNSCGRWADSAVEPGSGSTIMSYVGKCPPNVQDVADPYYHAHSIQEMQDNLATVTDCGTLTATGNTPPTADAGADYTIPRGTPFVLTGGGSDPDPGDTLTFLWDEMDHSPTSGDAVNGPLFRSRPATAAPWRYMPALATVLSGTSDPWEKLPTVNRLLHFRLVVRDGHPGTGGLAWDDKLITVSGTPFVVTYPNGGEAFLSGDSFTVTWTVGGGSVAPTVNILISADGGTNWTMLRPNTPNDGSETVKYYTGTTSTTCRIKVEAVGNIFYDVSNANFTMYGGPVGAPAGPAGPDRLALRLGGPNPWSARAALVMDLPRETRVDLGVYTVQGRRIRTLGAGRWVAGSYPISWAGEDDLGRRVGSGVYLVRLTTAEGSRTVRLVHLR